MKGVEMSIKTVAVVVLSVMVIVVVITTFESAFDQLVNNFLDGLDFAPQD